MLLQQLLYYGVKGVPLSLKRNYLTHIKQYVEIEDAKSEMHTISTVVTQGSILDPLLYIIYIKCNYFVKAIEQFYFIMYADDTTHSSILDSFPHM